MYQYPKIADEKKALPIAKKFGIVGGPILSLTRAK
jgi:hypothetical protein